MQKYKDHQQTTVWRNESHFLHECDVEQGNEVWCEWVDINVDQPGWNLWAEGKWCPVVEHPLLERVHRHQARQFHQFVWFHNSQHSESQDCQFHILVVS